MKFECKKYNIGENKRYYFNSFNNNHNCYANTNIYYNICRNRKRIVF